MVHHKISLRYTLNKVGQREIISAWIDQQSQIRVSFLVLVRSAMHRYGITCITSNHQIRKELLKPISENEMPEIEKTQKIRSDLWWQIGAEPDLDQLKSWIDAQISVKDSLILLIENAVYRCGFIDVDNYKTRMMLHE